MGIGNGIVGLGWDNKRGSRLGEVSENDREWHVPLCNYIGVMPHPQWQWGNDNGDHVTWLLTVKS